MNITQNSHAGMKYSEELPSCYVEVEQPELPWLHCARILRSSYLSEPQIKIRQGFKA